MDWIGSPELHFALAIFGVSMIGLCGYWYYRDGLSRKELSFGLVGALVWVAYTIEDASTVLSVPQFVSSLLATVTGVSFVGLFLYWAFNREEGAND